jgi:rhamnulokinase
MLAIALEKPSRRIPCRMGRVGAMLAIALKKPGLAKPGLAKPFPGFRQVDKKDQSVASLHLAVVDLGAESGRVSLARYDGTRLNFQEAYRFPNRPVQVRGHLYWNVLELWREMLDGLRRSRAISGDLHSIGVDTWGVDYALLDAQGFLLGLPFHYRDSRTQGMMEQVCARIPRETIYADTGIQFMSINTLYQLAAHMQMQPRLFEYADRLLMIPDIFHAWLSGIHVGERTNASTTQLWSVNEQCWSNQLLKALNVPSNIMPPVVEPGTLLGPLLPELAAELGSNVQVAVPATHDTASAIAAIPASEDEGWAYICSGTWSLVGLELLQPLIPTDIDANFTNEGGIFSTVRFLKNVTGLWILQECKRAWEKEGQTYSYAELFALAENAPAHSAFIDPDDPCFLTPGDMPARIQAYLAERNQPILVSPGEIVRCILESLVLRYRQVLAQASQLAGISLQRVHVVGGSSQNAMLNQWLADATGLSVVAGPVECSVLGNALVQLVALGELSTLAQVRALARSSVSTVTYQPDSGNRGAWDEANGRFQRLSS